MKRTYLTFLLCTFAVPLCASPPNALASQAITAQWDYDTAKKLLSVHLTNTSGKDISFFEILVTVTHPDGSTDSLHKATEFLTRMASAAISRTEGGPQGPGAFAPGATYDVPAPEAQNVQGVSIVVEVTAYADGTAENNNPFMFHHFVAERQGMLLAMQRATNVLKSAATKDDAVKQLEGLANASKTEAHGSKIEDPESHTEHTLRLVLSDLKQTDLQTLIKENDIRMAVYSAHVHVKEVRQ